MMGAHKKKKDRSRVVKATRSASRKASLREASEGSGLGPAVEAQDRRGVVTNVGDPNKKGSGAKA